ncbi:hypothetical protein FJTKL_00020 [Diaporthe vaccinii]|uniref:Uncharacterized protein n=1 Tax=Diaporthe vaccinii TaxID=105482 RepID=A0ABR4E4U4_9PEZI
MTRPARSFPRVGLADQGKEVIDASHYSAAMINQPVEEATIVHSINRNRCKNKPTSCCSSKRETSPLICVAWPLHSSVSQPLTGPPPLQEQAHSITLKSPAYNARTKPATCPCTLDQNLDSKYFQLEQNKY